MKQPTPNKDLLAPLRNLPLPLELGQVERMVAAFPAATGFVAWLARIRIHLNSILIMTISAATILIATLLLTGGPSPRPTASVVVPAKADTVQMEQPTSTTEVEAEKETTVPPVGLPAPQAAPTDTTSGKADHGPDTTLGAGPFIPVRSDIPAPKRYPISAAERPTARPETDAHTFPITGFTQLAIGSAPQVNPDGVRKRGKERTATNTKGTPTLVVHVEEGPFSASATGNEALVALIRASVVKGKAYLYWDVNADFPKGSQRDTVHMQVVLPRLESVAVLGPQRTIIGELHDSKDLELSMVGSGSIRLVRALALEKLQALQSGSGTIDCQEVGVRGELGLSQVGSGRIWVSGNAGSLVITQSGSGSVVCNGLAVGQEANLSQVGSGLVVLTGTTEALTITQSGSGRITCDGSGPWGTVELSQVGSGRATLTGEATDLTITLSSSGSVDASEVAVPTAQVSVTGSGTVKVDKAEEVNAVVAGSGSVHTRDGVKRKAR